MQKYINGSTARPLRTTTTKPKPRKHETKLTKTELRQIELERKFQRISAIAFVGFVCLMFFFSYSYLSILSESQTLSDEVVQLTSELNTITVSNDELEADIKSSIDYDEVFRVATEELGMKYPDRSQVITYDSSESEWVKQYKDIPEK